MNLVRSEKEFAEKVEKEVKSMEREFEKRVAKKAEIKRLEKGKGGQGKLQRVTVCWDPALSHCTKRNITGKNIFCLMVLTTSSVSLGCAL